MNRNHDYEFIKHIKGLGLHAYFVTIDQRIQHWHGEIEVLYVLQGSIWLSLDTENILLSQGDIFVVNHFEIHSLRQTGEGNLLFVIQFTPTFCKRYFSDLQYIRFSDRHLRHNQQDSRWSAVRQVLLDVIRTFADSKPNFQFLLMALLNTLVFTLLSELPYKITAQKEIDSYESNLDRLNRILLYIHNNAAYKITLEDLARREGLSTFYLSHFIRKHLGISYQKYLAQVRLSLAANMLSTTNKSVGSIAIESGFSDIKYLNRHFLETYGCRPAEYRLKNKKTDPPAISVFIGSSRELSLTNEVLKKLIEELTP
ncbi:MAG: AraC family transcriptional regulator [Saccharofermentanales bacterium]|jgi:AraC-like DNA-binding protein|nr:AraC family transcriptional regulator [Clostridiaceae bacterium]